MQMLSFAPKVHKSTSHKFLCIACGCYNVPAIDISECTGGKL
jgi:hypothetical protein